MTAAKKTRAQVAARQHLLLTRAAKNATVRAERAELKNGVLVELLQHTFDHFNVFPREFRARQILLEQITAAIGKHGLKRPHA